MTCKFAYAFVELSGRCGRYLVHSSLKKIMKKQFRDVQNDSEDRVEILLCGQRLYGYCK